MAAVPTASARKARAARLSVASNSGLILLKLVAGLLTGSVAILSDAIQSTMDLVASVITLFSVRQAELPPDAGHRYGHEKLEDLSAAVEALLLLAGAAVIGFEAIHRLMSGGGVDRLGVGIAVVAAAAAVNVVVSRHLASVAAETGSAALAADGTHLRSDALVSVGVLVALVLTLVTGAQWIDATVGLVVAAVIVVTALRILLSSGRRLIDESLPAEEMAVLTEVVESFVGDAVVGYHDLRARHSGASHQVDLHLQFRDGTTLREAHLVSHDLQDAVTGRLPNTSVLIHIEPEDRVREDRFDRASS